MGKRYLIDTNVIIGYLDSKLPKQAMEFMNGVVDDVPNVSVISQIEVLRFNAAADAYKTLEDFISESNIWGLDDLVVETTIVICKSSKIKLPDAIIASTAIVHDLILITRNTIDFKNIKDIQLLNPWD